MKKNMVSFSDVYKYIESKNNTKLKKAIKYILSAGNLMLPMIFSGYVSSKLISNIATGFTLAGTGIVPIVMAAINSLFEDNEKSSEEQYITMQVIYYMCFYASFFDTVKKEIVIEGYQDIWEGFGDEYSCEDEEYLKSIDDNVRISFDSLEEIKEKYDFLTENFRKSFFAIDEIRQLTCECGNQKDYFLEKVNSISNKAFSMFIQQIYIIGCQYEQFRWWICVRNWVEIEKLRNHIVKDLSENLVNDIAKKKALKKELFYRYKEDYFYLFNDKQCTVEDVFTLNNYRIMEYGEEDRKKIKNIEEVMELVNEYHYLLIVGPYGSGKTVLLKMLYLEYKKRNKNVYIYDASDLSGISSYDKVIEFKGFFDSICEGETIILIDAIDDLNIPSSQGADISVLEFFLNNMFKYMNENPNVYFIISSRKYAYIYENEEDSVADKVFCHTLQNTKMNMIESEKFDSEAVKKWIDNYPFSNGINTNKIKLENKKIMTALQNPLFLYIFIKQHENINEMNGDRGYYYYYEQFINKTIKGKYFNESACGAHVIAKNVTKYRKLLCRIAYDILKINSNKIKSIVNPLEIQEEQPLLDNVLQDYRFFISYNDFSETTKNDFEDLKSDAIDKANFLNCYFFKNIGEQVFFTDINILFMLAAERIYDQLILQVQKKKSFSLENLNDLDVIDFYPQIVDYIIYKLKEVGKLKIIREYLRSFVSNDNIRNRINVLQGNKKELKETFAQILMMYILFFKFNQNSLLGEYRHIFKEMVYYSNAYKTFAYQKGLEDNIFTIERYFIGNILKDLCLNRVNLKNFNFKSSIIKNAEFKQCKFYDTIFFNAEIDGKIKYELCELKKSNMKFEKSNKENQISFYNCNIDDVKLNGQKECKFVRCFIKNLNINVDYTRNAVFRECSIEKIIFEGKSLATDIEFEACIFKTPIDLLKYKGKIYIQTKCLKLSDEALFKNFKNERLNGSDKIV